MPPSTTRFRVRLPSLAGNLTRTGPCSLSLCPRNAKGMEIKNHNPEILPFAFSKGKGNIRRPTNVSVETQREGETLGYGHKAVGTSAYTETRPARPLGRLKDRNVGRLGRRSFMSNSSGSVFCPKQLTRPPRFCSAHTIKCYRNSPWNAQHLFICGKDFHVPTAWFITGN